jgi:hypothetical protein
MLSITRLSLNARIAKNPRTDPLQELILGVFRKNPSATKADVLREIQAHERLGVIESVTGEVIEWMDRNRCRETPIRALNHRISRARKKLEYH